MALKILIPAHGPLLLVLLGQVVAQLLDEALEDGGGRLLLCLLQIRGILI